ncbi:MAG: penicillin-binding protein 2 [Alphaproteobacteria bacterium]|nr:penicillin-binding protein 2 [Alphaproteobacteria bacterium]
MSLFSLFGRAAETPDAQRKTVETGHVRLIVTGALFMVAFSVIAGRMVDVMVLKGADSQPQRRLAQTVDHRMQRADIVDRNGVLLATSLPTVSLYAKPKEILDANEATAKLLRVLPELSHTEVLNKLSGERGFIYLRRNLTPRQQYDVNALGIPGLYFEDGERRVYPQGPLAAHVVGMTDLDNKGIAGIEKTFDGALTGRQPLALALDLRVQTVLRDELRRAIADFSAVGATGVVMDVRSGEMLAMVSLPDFDPNAPSTATEEARFNRTTLGVYEMGSTFKLFNTAAALDAGIANPDSVFDATNPIQISRFSISDYHSLKRPMSVAEILVHSSNVGSAKMAMSLGGERQKEFLGRLGMLRPVAIELPEVGSPLVPSPWREISTMTISYGHGMAVTPLHLASGVGALINGGWFRQPTLLRQDPQTPVPARRVVDDRTSKNMRKMMRMVVEEGTGGKADVPGYQVGGKTGTAEKAGGAGGYRTKSLLSSFVGAFPMNDPRYVVLVMVDEPHGTKESFGYATGGWVAAPPVSRIVAQIAPMLGIGPVLEAQAAVPVQKASTRERAIVAVE